MAQRTVSIAISTVLLGALALAGPFHLASAETADDPDRADAPGADEDAPSAELQGNADADDDEVDVDALRRDYLELRDRLFRSRARAQAVASALYSTELRVHLDFPRDRFVTPTRAAIRLNGATIYEDEEGQIAGDRAPRFEGFIAPGPHKLTISVEAASRDDARFETASEHTFTVVAPRGSRVVVSAEAGDGGDIGYRWDRSQSGSHKLHLNVDIKTEKRQADKDA